MNRSLVASSMVTSVTIGRLERGLKYKQLFIDDKGCLNAEQRGIPIHMVNTRPDGSYVQERVTHSHIVIFSGESYRLSQSIRRQRASGNAIEIRDAIHYPIGAVKQMKPMELQFTIRLIGEPHTEIDEFQKSFTQIASRRILPKKECSS